MFADIITDILFLLNYFYFKTLILVITCEGSDLPNCHEINMTVYKTLVKALILG